MAGSSNKSNIGFPLLTEILFGSIYLWTYVSEFNVSTNDERNSKSGFLLFVK